MFDKYTWMCSQIVELSDNAMIATDRDYNIILFNQAAEKTFGYDAKEILGKHLNVLIPDRYHLQHNLLMSDFADSKVKSRPMSETTRSSLGIRRSGEEFLAGISIMKMGSKSNPIFGAVIRDLDREGTSEGESIRREITDPLTGAFSEKEFLVLADREVLRSKRYNRPLSLFILQIDNFVSLYDIYGHHAVDKTLREVMKSCHHTLRNVDVIGRWEKSGFGSILPETDLESAKRTAERIKEDLSSLEVEFKKKKVNFSVSIAIVEFNESKDETIDEQLSNLSRSLSEKMKESSDITIT